MIWVMLLLGVGVPRGSHLTPASSLWAQLWLPRGLAGQAARRASVPAQLTLSSQMIPVPWPNRARTMAWLPEVGKPTVIAANAGEFCFTCWRESQLSANYVSIRCAPQIITHSSPDIIVTEFHTAFPGISSTHKPQVTICTC